MNTPFGYARPLFFAVTCAVCTTFGQVTSPFTFAFISDTHVGSTTGAADLAATVHDITGIDSVSFVVLTGDITELGWNSQFALAKSILDSLRKPYYIIPGNHDTKWSESGCTQFVRTFGADRFVFKHGGLLFFALHEGPMMRMGDGHFAPEDIRWIYSLLATISTATPLVFLTHYPLDPGLDNWYEMTDRLRRFNTQMVLVGHGHSNHAMNFEGIPAVMGRSNLRANRPVGGYTLVRVDKDSAVFFERTPGVTTKPAWTAIGLGTRAFGATPVDVVRPNDSVNARFPRISAVWKFTTGTTITGGPCMAGDRVIVGDRSGLVQARRVIDGGLVWSFQARNGVMSTPDARGNSVVFTSAEGAVYCLELATGKLRWRRETQSANVACPAIVGSTVYVGGSDGIFRALDLRNGNVQWEYDSVKAFVESRPLITSTSVVFGAWDSYLYCLSQRDGKLRWKWNNGTTGFGLSPAAAWPVEHDGRIFVAAPDRAATVLDEKTGAVVWRSKEHQVREAVGISEDGSRFYGKCMNDTLFAYDAAASGQRLAWATDCGYGYDIDPSMPQEKNGTVFFGTKNGLVYALDAKSGQIRWTHKVSNTIVNTVAPVNGTSVIVTDFDGNVQLLGLNEMK